MNLLLAPTDNSGQPGLAIPTGRANPTFGLPDPKLVVHRWVEVVYGVLHLTESLHRLNIMYLSGRLVRLRVAYRWLRPVGLNLN